MKRLSEDGYRPPSIGKMIGMNHATVYHHLNLKKTYVNRLSELNDYEKGFIKEKYFYGWKSQDIADALCRKRSTVSNYIYKTREFIPINEIRCVSLDKARKILRPDSNKLQGNIHRGESQRRAV